MTDHPTLTDCLEALPIWVFRLGALAMIAGAFGLIGWLIGGWPVGAGAALISGGLAVPYLTGINDH